MKFRSSAGISGRLAIGAALLLSAALANAAPSTRPKLGGTLRIELRERVPMLDPRVRPIESEVARAQEMLDALVFDRLVTLDDNGRPAPALAVVWQSENGDKMWRFQLRPGVQFSDGMPLTSDLAAAALAIDMAPEFGSGMHVTSAGDWLTIESDEAMPNLPQQLAVGRNFIFRTGPDGKSVLGTGPFVLDHWDAAASPAQIVFPANARCWAGRPFADRVAVSLGVESARIEADLEFGLADLGELGSAEMRRATESGVRVWSSEPMDLFVLTFDSRSPAAQNGHLRQAVAAAIDRTAIVNVVLQRQAIPAGALMPEWISGYAFLFPASLPASPQNSAAAVRPAAPLVLVYDSKDEEAHAVADRVIVDLRAAGILAEAVAGSSADRSKRGSTSADIRLIRVAIAQPDAGAALTLVWSALSATAQVSQSLDAPVAAPGAAALSSSDPESLYAAERAALSDFHFVPIAHATENWGIGASVRDWMPTRWGTLRLEDVWLDSAPAGSLPAPAAGSVEKPQ